MGMVSEFRNSSPRATCSTLAVGVVIGAAFGKIVSSLVDGIIMPLVGVLTGGVNVSDWKYVLSPARTDAAGETAAEVAVKYGDFLQQIVNFHHRLRDLPRGPGLAQSPPTRPRPRRRKTCCCCARSAIR